jgi:phosphoribosylanthranilate isomerase
MILVDAGMGDGVSFDWNLLKNFNRPYILAGGLDPLNVKGAVEKLHPYGVDVSSGIETAGVKDIGKMREFVFRVRG